jgi:CRP/FNR family transcriptional regulator, putaive post-exponential-phase nitrogen-starvation regulator
MHIIRPEKTIQHYISTFNMASFLNDDLLASLQHFHFPTYTNIYIEEDEQHFLYFLVEGQVQCSHYHLNGRLAVIALSQPFTAIGDFEILSEERVYSNVIATQDTTMLGIARSVVQRYGADDSRFLRFLIDQLREKLYQTNSLQMNQVLPVIKRLALYILAHPTKNEDGVVVLPNKEDFASLLGTTPRHLNRVLRELVESGGISATYPRVHILNRLALQDLTL